MRKHTVIFLTILVMIIISACSPSEAVIQAAIAKTQTMQIAKDNQATPEHTPTPQPDLKVIDVNIQDFLPSMDDLEQKGLSMFGAKETAYEYTNEKMLKRDLYSDRYEQTRARVFDLGRVTSFYGNFVPKSPGETTITRLGYEITLYKTATGARKDWENDIDYFQSIEKDIREDLGIGDASRSYRSISYSADFLLKNILVNTWTEVKDINSPDISNGLEISESLAQIIFDKFKTVQLVDSSDASFSNMVVDEPTKDVHKNPKTACYYLVNDEIAAGHWRTDSSNHSCYYSITNSEGKILDNFLGRADGRDFFIWSGAFEVELGKDCGTWHYMGD